MAATGAVTGAESQTSFVGMEAAGVADQFGVDPARGLRAQEASTRLQSQICASAT
jgi:hypothetical protein